MKGFVTAVVVSVTLAACAPAFAEVAVIPYRVDNPSTYFPEKSGDEYAKLLGVVLAVRKGMEVYPPRDLDADMKSFGISSQGTITAEGLKALGAGRYLDRIVLGKISKTGETYVAESTLYAPGRGKVIARTQVKGQSLAACAEKDAAELFVTAPDAPLKLDPAADQGLATVDLVVVTDTSYAMSAEWETVKAGITGFAGALSENWSAPIRIYVLGFSDAQKLPSYAQPVGSPAALRAGLDATPPRGGPSTDALEAALRFAVTNVPWERGSVRHMLVVSNSPVRRNSQVELSGMTAQKRGIVVSAAAGGRCQWEDAETLRQLAVMGKGRFAQFAYRQRVYDARGKSIDLFMEGGRFFQGQAYGAQWKEGLFSFSGKASSFMQPKPFLAEIMADRKKYELSPYAMSELYPEIANVALVNADPVENNADVLLPGLGAGASSRGRAGGPHALAKALLSDGKVSIWVRIASQADLDFFKNRESMRAYFTLGVTVQRKPDEAYGFTFHPARFITRLGDDQVPDAARAGINEMAARPDFYINNGLLKPPVWFVRVKVEALEPVKEAEDVRD
ncbi:MAG: VWA domain-containing protein [Spirochaetes bacterium]|nr:MAG: VWA domain-containing protein [Spirochaetota bacterium]